MTIQRSKNIASSTNKGGIGECGSGARAKWVS